MTLRPKDLRHGYDLSAADYDARFRALQAPKYDAVLARYLPPPAARVCDLGCGTGMLLARLGHLRTPPVALDLSLSMLRAGAFEGARPVQGDLLHLPFVDRSFDAIFAITSLLVTPDMAVAAFLEARRILVQGGVLALTVLEREVYDGLEDDLKASGLDPGERFACGQDLGWICRRA